MKRISVLTSESSITSILIKDFIDPDIPQAEIKDNELNNKSEKDNLRNYLDSFLNKFFKSLDNDSEAIDLYEKFMDEFERPLILKTLDFCKGIR